MLDHHRRSRGVPMGVLEAEQRTTPIAALSLMPALLFPTQAVQFMGRQLECSLFPPE